MLAVVALVASGCGGDDDGSSSETVATATPTTAPATTETVAAPVATTETVAETPATSGELTKIGSTLKVGETARIAYTDASKPGKKSVIAVTPVKIEKGTLDDFKNIDLDADQKASTPYYATVKVENVGDGDLSGTEPGSYINGIDDRGQDQNELIFFGDFDRCPEADPKSLKPGESYETCLTYLIPGGGSVEGFRWIVFDEKTGESNIDWKQ